MLALLGVAVLAVVLFVVLRPSGNDSTKPQTTRRTSTQTSTATTTAAQASPTDIAIEIRGGEPVAGITKATVKQGERVVLIVRSDVADEIHLHGYDKQVDVDAGGTARLAFRATIAGRFEAELESRGEQILELTVEP